MDDPSPRQPSTDEERLARLSSSLCTMWAMVQRGIWPRSLLTRHLPTEITTALPPIPPPRPGSLQISKTEHVLVDVRDDYLAHASAVIHHPDSNAEGVLLAYRRRSPQQSWRTAQFVPLRYRHLELAYINVTPPPPARIDRLRDDIRALLGEPPQTSALWGDWNDAAQWLARYAHDHDIHDLKTHVHNVRSVAAMNPSSASAYRVVQQYQDLATIEQARNRQRTRQVEPATSLEISR